jgi:hypothetical protein
MMFRRLVSLAAFLVVALPVPFAVAGVYSDDLAKCLVSSTKPDDQLLFIQWMFSAISLHPAVQPLSSITSEQREELNRKAAEFFGRLVSEDCRSQAIDAIKYEGPTALGPAFNVLGQVAMRGLMSNPLVAKGMSELGTYIQQNNKVMEMFKAAGVNPKRDPAEAPTK